MPFPERRGQRFKWAPLEHDVVCPGNLEYPRARLVPAVIHERFVRGEPEHELQPTANVVGAGGQGDQRLDDDVPQGPAASSRFERWVVERDQRPLAPPARDLRLSPRVDGFVSRLQRHAAEVVVREVVDDYDFDASVIKVLSRPGAWVAPVKSRALPMHVSSIGSYGR